MHIPSLTPGVTHTIITPSTHMCIRDELTVTPIINRLDEKTTANREPYTETAYRQ